MLSTNAEQPAERMYDVSSNASNAPNKSSHAEIKQDCPHTGQSRLTRMLRIEWLGQTVASVCWIGSVFNYGLSSSGDWLQLLAASSWLLANIASVAATETS